MFHINCIWKQNNKLFWTHFNRSGKRTGVVLSLSPTLNHILLEVETCLEWGSKLIIVLSVKCNWSTLQVGGWCRGVSPAPSVWLWQQVSRWKVQEHPPQEQSQSHCSPTQTTEPKWPSGKDLGYSMQYGQVIPCRSKIAQDVLVLGSQGIHYLDESYSNWIWRSKEPHIHNLLWDVLWSSPWR